MKDSPPPSHHPPRLQQRPSPLHCFSPCSNNVKTNNSLHISTRNKEETDNHDNNHNGKKKCPWKWLTVLGTEFPYDYEMDIFSLKCMFRLYRISVKSVTIISMY